MKQPIFLLSQPKFRVQKGLSHEIERGCKMCGWIEQNKKKDPELFLKLLVASWIFMIYSGSLDYKQDGSVCLSDSLLANVSATAPEGNQYILANH
jgi:hypothetical protein